MTKRQVTPHLTAGLDLSLSTGLPGGLVFFRGSLPPQNWLLTQKILSSLYDDNDLQQSVPPPNVPDSPPQKKSENLQEALINIHRPTVDDSQCADHSPSVALQLDFGTPVNQNYSSNFNPHTFLLVNSRALVILLLISVVCGV